MKTKIRETYTPVTTSNGTRTVEIKRERLQNEEWETLGVALASGEVNCTWIADTNWSPEQAGYFGSQIADIRIAFTPAITEYGVRRIVAY